MIDEPVPPPELIGVRATVRPFGNGYEVTWSDESMQMRFLNLLTRSDGNTTSEVTIERVHGWLAEIEGPLCSYERVSLTSRQARVLFANDLLRRMEAIPWRARIETAFQQVITAHRRGHPPIALPDIPDADPLTYLFPPFVVRDELNLWYGEGKTWKSSLAQLVGLLVATGVEHPHLGRCPAPVPVLYVDFERSPKVQKARMRLLANGMGWTELPRNFFYLHATRPLHTLVSGIQNYLAEREIGFVLVDSIAGASVGELEGSESAGMVLNAMRELPSTHLGIDHVRSPEPGASPTRVTKAFGSVTKMNRSRNTWEVRLVERMPGYLFIKLIHRDLSSGEPGPPWGLRLCHTTEAITVEKLSVDQMPDLERSMDCASQVLLQLGRGKKTLSELLPLIEDYKEKTIKNSLTYLKQAGAVLHHEHESSWSLPVRAGEQQETQEEWVV